MILARDFFDRVSEAKETQVDSMGIGGIDGDSRPYVIIQLRTISGEQIH